MNGIKCKISSVKSRHGLGDGLKCHLYVGENKARTTRPILTLHLVS